MSHLGGHQGITHIDEDTLKYIINRFGSNSFVDIGCGPGGMVILAKELGLKSWGIDGDSSLVNVWQGKGVDNVIHDYTKGVYNITTTDICWCVEFLEHIEEQYLDNVFSTMKNCNVVCMTHALPGKGGHHHVNCQTEEYWDKKFEEHGFKKIVNMTNDIRNISTMEREFIRETGKLYLNVKNYY